MTIYLFPILFILILFCIIFSIVINISPYHFINALLSDEVLFALTLSLKTSIIATVLALIVGVPSGYVLSRKDFRFKELIDSFINLPILLPPLILGLGLLIFLGNPPGEYIQKFIQIVFTEKGIILAQFIISSPFIIKTSRATFEGIDVKYEQIAKSLGLSDLETFFKITLPMAKNGILSGAILGWARSVGEFGATLMVAGATRMKTETMPIAIFLNVSVGNLNLALTIALIHIVIAVLVITVVKLLFNSKSYEY